MAGRRQHYIPQFLLRQFGDENGAIKVINADCSTYKTNTKNVALEKDFHGLPGAESTDEAITQEEQVVKPILDDLLQYQSGEVASSNAAKLLAHFATRTAAARAQMVAIGREVSDAVLGPASLDTMALEFIEEQLTLSNRQLGKAKIKAMATLMYSQNRETIIAQVRRLRDTWESSLPTSVASAQNAVLRRQPTPEKRVAWFAGFQYVVADFSGCLVLSDSVVWGISQGAVGLPLIEHADWIDHVVMPISCSRCVIGFRSKYNLFPEELINFASFAASDRFVVAHPGGGDYAELIPEMGTGMPVMLSRLQVTS